MKKKEFDLKCCFCGCQVEGIGHNPYPVVKRRGAVCCNFCDANIILPVRFSEMRANDSAEHR